VDVVGSVMKLSTRLELSVCVRVTPNLILAGGASPASNDPSCRRIFRRFNNLVPSRRSHSLLSSFVHNHPEIRRRGAFHASGDAETCLDGGGSNTEHLKLDVTCQVSVQDDRGPWSIDGVTRAAVPRI
jgi:hypothetical protein